MARYAKRKDATLNAAATLSSMSAMAPQRPRSESCPDYKSPERKSRSVKFAPCLRTTRYYHPEKDKAYCVSRRPRAASWGSHVVRQTIEEEGSEREYGEEIVLPAGSL